ncbi:MAG: ATP-binding protein [Archangium sp.]|nr:ATP-binding protein [Archangium sp.]
MSRLLPQRVEESSGEDGFRALIDELPVGLVWVSESGEAMDWNNPAETLLASGAGLRIEQLIGRLLEACRTTRTCIQSGLELSGSERVQVSVAPDRRGDAFMVVLDRQRLEKARTEASVLRAVLKAIASSTTRQQALQRALEAVHTALNATHLAFFELDPTGTRFSCVASSGLPAHDAAEAVALRNEVNESVLAVVLQHRRPVTLPDLASCESPVPFRRERGLAAALMPVFGRSAKGVLYLSTRDGLSEGLLRLCHALADAVGAVLDLATLEQEANRAREVATQRDRLATIGQLVAGVAHEINNPLAFLKSNLNSLRGDLDDLREGRSTSPMSEVDDMVSESLEGVSRIEAIVQALKGTARKKDERIRFEPGRAVSEAVTIFRGAHKQNVDVECRVGRLPEVMGSPSALGQITLNLMQNGIDAMSELPRNKRKLEISSRSDAAQVVILVRDYGTGIPLDVQKRMFDAFFTTKDPGKGTGLGLAICKEIVASMGGTLTFTTGSDGTCFEVAVPLDLTD